MDQSEEHSQDIRYIGGKARYFRSHFEGDLKTYLKKCLIEARDYKRDRQVSKTRARLLSDLKQRGIRPQAQVRLDDRTDVTGLIGEMMAEWHSQLRKCNMLWVKWRIGGTSKSNGIDLIARIRRGSDWQLRLIESKHLHTEAKGVSHRECCMAIRNRFLDGIGGFDHDNTISNLAGVVILMGRNIQLNRAAGRDTREAEESRDFVQSRLAQNGYACEVVVIIDSKYCDDKSLSESVKDLQYPTNVGDHVLDLLLVACEGLEVVTDGISQEFF